MNKSTKLNGAIRALYKSKAKEAIENASKLKINPARKEIADTLSQINSIPEISKLARKHAALMKLAKVIGEQLNAMGLSPNLNGTVEYVWKVPKGARFYSSFTRKQELEAQISEAAACKCHSGDSPELLEFAANLSLCKTVGEAESLLANIK